MSNILILGATSKIAEEAARLWAEEGHALCLVGRNRERLSVIADDLKARGASRVFVQTQDLIDHTRHAALLESAEKTLGEVDIALVAHGLLGDHRGAQHDAGMVRLMFETNLLSPVSLITLLADKFEKRGRGTIAAISSVAGERGRGSNYVYGSAKGGLSRYLQGVRNRLHKSGVNVVTILPGFVDTPMTRDFKKSFLWASPERIADGIVTACKKRRDVVYLPWFWFWIMLVVRHIPECIFKRLNL